MEPIDIEGKLINQCLARIRLTKLLKSLKEMENEIEELEKLVGYSSDYASYAIGLRKLN